MAFAITDIINWSKICQPLARQGYVQKTAFQGMDVEEDLDIKIYCTRKDVEYEYAKDPTGAAAFTMANYLYALLFPYIFKAKQASGSGGSIAPFTPLSIPDPLDFIVSSQTIIATGDTSAYLYSLRGYNIEFFRGSMTQYTTDPTDGSTYYSWDKTTALLTLLNGAAQEGERFRLSPVLGGGTNVGINVSGNFYELE